MNNVIPLPSAAPATSVTVMDETFVERLSVANTLTRKLRGWQIGVEAVYIPPSREQAPPMLCLRHDPARSIKPLLDATMESRKWLPASSRMPDRMVAELDGCMLMWVLRDRRVRPRLIKRVCHV